MRTPFPLPSPPTSVLVVAYSMAEACGILWPLMAPARQSSLVGLYVRGGALSGRGVRGLLLVALWPFCSWHAGR